MSWGLVASAGATIVGGVMGSKAAGKAADAQAAGAANATAEQRRQFDITQANMQPFQQAGTAALDQQRILMGLGSSQYEDPNAAARTDLQSQIAAYDANPARIEDFSSSERALAGNMGIDLVAMENEKRSPGLSGLQSQLDALPQFDASGAPSAAEQQQSAFDAFNNSPGQQFIRDRAQKSLLRNASAIGGLGGGNVRSALVQQGAGFAQQDFNNQFGRLGQMAGQGQVAATNVSQFGQQSANQIGGNMMMAGNARASGLTNQSNAMQNTISGLGNVAGQYFGQSNSNIPSNAGRTQFQLI